MDKDYWAWMFSDEGRIEYQRQMQKIQDEQRKRWHAGRFHRWAENHDRRIPHGTRVAVLMRANEHCERCGKFVYAGTVPAQLELHHRTYERAYGRELPEDLLALCRNCHRIMHLTVRFTNQRNRP